MDLHLHSTTRKIRSFQSLFVVRWFSRQVEIESLSFRDHAPLFRPPAANTLALRDQRWVWPHVNAKRPPGAAFLNLKLGAGDEIRTRDLLVGNEKLYH